MAGELRIKLRAVQTLEKRRSARGVNVIPAARVPTRYHGHSLVWGWGWGWGAEKVALMQDGGCFWFLLTHSGLLQGQIR